MLERKGNVGEERHLCQHETPVAIIPCYCGCPRLLMLPGGEERLICWRGKAFMSTRDTFCNHTWRRDSSSVSSLAFVLVKGCSFTSTIFFLTEMTSSKAHFMARRYAVRASSFLPRDR